MTARPGAPPPGARRPKRGARARHAGATSTAPTRPRSRPVARAAAALALSVAAAGAARAQEGIDRLVPPSPAPDGFVADDGPVLDSAARARLNARVADVQRRTGGDVGVAILRDLGGRAPADVGVAIYRAWRIGAVDSLGAARRHLGALLLIVPKELAPSRRGECWVTTGLGAEGTLRDAVAGAICRDSVIPHLRARRYEDAVAAGVGAVGAALARAADGDGRAAARPAAGPPARPRVPWPVAVLLTGGIAVAGAGVAAARRRRRPRPCPRGHGPMARLDAAAEASALTDGQRCEQRVDSVDYDVWACARCDERVVIPYLRWSARYGLCPGCSHWTVETERRTLFAATRDAEGLDEATTTCVHCGWREVRQHRTSRLPARGGSSGGSSGGSGSGGGSGGSSGGSSSFGGDGGTSGGGGGASY